VTPVQFRLVVSRVLIVGVGTSAALIAIGFVGSLLVGWDGSMLGARAGGGAPTDFGTIQAGLWALRPVAIAQAGLLVLVATPVVRVAASVIAFTLEGDRLYASITLAVLAILLTSLLILR
jgi:uncharacterized membrane protein